MTQKEIDIHWMPDWLPWWNIRASDSGFEVFDRSLKLVVFASADWQLVRRFYAAPMIYRAAGALLVVCDRRKRAPQLISTRRVELFKEVLTDMVAFADGKEIPLFADQPSFIIAPLPEDSTDEERHRQTVLETVSGIPVHGSEGSTSDPWHVAMTRRGLEPFFLNAVGWDEDEYLTLRGDEE